MPIYYNPKEINTPSAFNKSISKGKSSTYSTNYTLINMRINQTSGGVLHRIFRKCRTRFFHILINIKNLHTHLTRKYGISVLELFGSVLD